VIGALAGGLLTVRLGIVRALILCGVLQSAGNLFYVLQAMGGHRLDYLALCVAAENVTGAMTGAAPSRRIDRRRSRWYADRNGRLKGL